MDCDGDKALQNRTKDLVKVWEDEGDNSHVRDVEMI